MIELELLSPGSQLARLHPGAVPGPSELWKGTWVYAPDAIDPRGVWLKGMRADMTRGDWCDLMRQARSLGYSTLMARRRPDQPVPLGVLGDDGITRVSLPRVLQRLGW